MMRIENSIKNKLIYPVAAALPVVFMLIAYACMGFYPFGDQTIYTWDLEGQYSSFMMLTHHLLTGQGHLNYSLTGGLGGNLYGMAAYYLGSPFNLIMVFFNERTMPVGIMLLTLMKTAGMGFFMFLYLYRKKQSSAAILFSTAYAFSAYAIAYQSNIMWMDALVFLPLVIWGLEDLIEEGKCLLYVIFLGLTIISNYFMAYMVCIFVVLYFIGYILFTGWGEHSIKKKLQTAARFTISSLWGGGLSAFLLLPMLYGMQDGISKMNVSAEAIGNGARLFYYRSILPMFMACSYDDSQRWDVIGTFPLLYCGVIVISGLWLFFVLKSISWKRKIFQVFLMMILLISCNHMNLFFAWHGFYTPFGAPWRFIFIWSFVVLTAAYEGTAVFLEEKNRIYDHMVISGVGLFFFWVFWRFESYRPITGFNIIIIAGIFLGLFLWKYGKKRRRIIPSLICITVIGIELICNALFTWGQGFEYESYSAYQDYIDRMEGIFIEEEPPHRCVIAEGTKRNLNDGFLWNTNTIELYTSTIKRKTSEIGEYLDLGDFKVIGAYNTRTTLLTKSIVSLKYIYGGETADAGYEIVGTTKEGINIFENKSALPFGFLVNKTAPDITLEDREKDIYEKQNMLFRALAGSQGIEDDVYKAGADENIELVQTAVEKTAEYTLSVVSETDSDITSRIRNDLGETAYVCYSVPCEQGWKAAVDGKEEAVIEGMGGFLLVPVEEGEHEVRITYITPGSRLGGLVSLICLAGIGIYAFRCRKKKIFQNC